MELLKVRVSIPIILCTGQSDHVSQEMTRQIGIKQLLMKPSTIQEMAQTIRRVLDEKQDVQ